MRRSLVVTSVIALVLVAGAAAYWTATGSGAGSTTLDNPQALTLSPGTPTTELYPTGDADVAVVATNPNLYEVEIGSIFLDTGEGTGGFDVDAGHAGCDVSTLNLPAQDNGGAGWTVPARTGGTDGSLSIHLAGALAMGAGAADACQGASFTVHLTAGA